jgi:hypothetical protein
MDASPKVSLPPPPGIVNSIKTGFDLVANNLGVVLPPLLFNLFLWLGPRLRMDALFNAVKLDMAAVWQEGGVPAAEIERALNLYETTLPRLNLFWLFRTFPIGISSLFLPHETSGTPLGQPIVWQAGALDLPLWIFLLTLLGWVGGALYFRDVARLAQTERDALSFGALRAVLQTIFLSISWGFLSIFIGLPSFMLMAVLLQFNALAANLLTAFFVLIMMWAIVPLFFCPHGIFLKRQNMFASIWGSLQLSRFAFPTSSLFVLTVFLLSFGLNFLWTIPPEDSWMTLVGILGHSFVATALLASSFVYYRDMTAWVQSVLERFKPAPPKLA